MRLHLRRRRPERTERSLVNDEDAGWIRSARRPFDAHDVGSLVPVVFEQYARVLQPAWADPSTPVRWNAVSGWSGRTVHALAQWELVSRPLVNTGAPCPFLGQPHRGGLPPHELETLCRILASYTTTPDRCFVGVWEGYGWLPLSDCASGPELRLDQRTFLVTEGPISTATGVGWQPDERALLVTERPISTATGVGWQPDLGGTFTPEPPTLIWPADRAWFVASDVDLDSTYIGGSENLIAAVLAEPGLEAWPASSTDRVSIDSDMISAT